MIRRASSLVTACLSVAAIGGCGDDAATSQTLITATSAAASNSAAATNAPLATTPAPTNAAQTNAVPTTTTLFTASPLTVVAVTEEATVAPPPSIDPAFETLVGHAVSDLATRLNIDSSKVETLSAQAMSWPDGSLGCPQPGLAYTQVMVDGALIELGVDGTTYSYHSGGSTAPFLCQKT